ncbi:MAG: oligosaccharide flippase family protein [Patescibacteria group bacterium]
MNVIKKKTIEVLRRLQGWTKTDMVYLAKGCFWLTFGQAITAVSSFLLAIAFANLLSPEEYGMYKYVLSAVIILSIPTLDGMNSAIVRAVVRGFDGSVKPIIKLRIRWGLFGGLASLAFAGYYWYVGQSSLAIAFLIVSAFVPFLDSINLYTGFLMDRKEFKTLSIYNVIISVGAAIVVAGTLFFTKNIFFLIFAYFFSNTLLRLIITLVTLKKYQLNDRREADTVSYGKHLSLMGIILKIADQLDKVLIFNFLGAAQVAVYSFAILPVQEARLPLRNLGVISQPKFSQRSIAELKKHLPPKMLKFFLVLVFFVATYIIFSPIIFKVFFPQYLDSVAYSQVYSLSLLFFPAMFLLRVLIAHAQKRQLYWLRIAVPAFKVIFFFIALPVWGIWGAIASQLAAEAANAGLLIYYFNKL